MSKDAKRWELLAALLLLMVGFMLYLLFRPRTLLLFWLADLSGMAPWVDQWRQAMADCHLPSFVVVSLPGALWSASFVLTIDALLAGQPRRVQLLGASVIPLIGVASEMLQAFKLLPGEADWADAVCYAVPLLVYVVIKKL